MHSVQVVLFLVALATVVATFADQTLVQAASLFNDATSLVLFRIAIAAALAGAWRTWRPPPRAQPTWTRGRSSRSGSAWRSTSLVTGGTSPPPKTRYRSIATTGLPSVQWK